jgi:hypothetical protein
MELNTRAFFVDYENNNFKIITDRINFMKLEELALWRHLFTDEAAENHTLWHRTHSLSTEQRTVVDPRSIANGRQYLFLLPSPMLVKECTTDIPVISARIIPFMWGVLL